MLEITSDHWPTAREYSSRAASMHTHKTKQPIIKPEKWQKNEARRSNWNWKKGARARLLDEFSEKQYWAASSSSNKRNDVRAKVVKIARRFLYTPSSPAVMQAVGRFLTRLCAGPLRWLQSCTARVRAFVFGWGPVMSATRGARRFDEASLLT